MLKTVFPVRRGRSSGKLKEFDVEQLLKEAETKVRRVEKRKRGGEEENQKEVEEQKVEVEEERPIIEPTSRKRRKVDLEKPAYKTYGIILPDDYKLLSNQFNALDASYLFLQSRGETIIFEKIKKNVENQSRKIFTLPQVGKIKFIYKNSYHLVSIIYQKNSSVLFKMILVDQVSERPKIMLELLTQYYEQNLEKNNLEIPIDLPPQITPTQPQTLNLNQNQNQNQPETETENQNQNQTKFIQEGKFKGVPSSILDKIKKKAESGNEEEEERKKKLLESRIGGIDSIITSYFQLEKKNVQEEEILILKIQESLKIPLSRDEIVDIMKEMQTMELLVWKSGKRYWKKIEKKNKVTGNATIILHWSSDSTSKQPIPFEQFNHYDCQDNSTSFGPNGCATIKLASYEYSKITKKTKFCYEINVLSEYGNQCDIGSLQMNSINCGSPKISGITKFVGGTKGQYCLEYNNHVQIVPTTTMDLSFPNQSSTKTLNQTIPGPICSSFNACTNGCA